MIRVSELSYAFDAKPVLRQVSFQVQEKCIAGVLGRNGSGKSTLIRILSGELSGYSGSINVLGHVRLPPEVKKKVAVVFQAPSLDPMLTVVENLKLTARVYAVEKPKRRILDVLEQVELMDRQHDRVATLSAGYARRVDLARALLPEPELLLLDEPTASLDEHQFRLFWSLMAPLRKQMTILLTTHRAEEATHCDHLFVLKDACFIHEGSPQQLMSCMTSHVLELTTADPRSTLAHIQKTLGLTGFFHGRKIYLEAPHPQTVLSQLAPVMTETSIASVMIKSATLADLFVKLTGETLD